MVIILGTAQVPVTECIPVVYLDRVLLCIVTSSQSRVQQIFS